MKLKTGKKCTLLRVKGQAALTQWQKRHRATASRDRTGLTKDEIHTFGGLTRDSPIVMEDFDDHNVFVCSKPVIHPETQRLVVVLSTENLLLNAHRATQCGMPLG